MKKTGVALLILGILVAMPYMVYIESMSGDEIGRFNVMSAKPGLASAAHLTMGKTHKEAKIVGPIELNPEMNPLRMKLQINRVLSTTKRNPPIPYEIKLFNEQNEEVWVKKGSLIPPPENKDKKIK